MRIEHRCRWVRHRLPLLAGGELGMEERRKVERHLIGCADCQGRRDASADALAALRSVAAAGSPGRPDAPTLWPALARQIRESHHRPTWRDRLAFRAGPSLGVAFGVGGLAVVALALGRPAPAPRSVATTGASRDIPAGLPTPTTRALPDGPARPGLLDSPNFDPPSGVRFDYVLDRGTPLEPGDRDPRRSY